MNERGRSPVVPLSGPSSARLKARRERRALRVGLGLSAVVHVLAAGIIGGLLGRSPVSPAGGPTPLYVEPPRGMRAIEISPVATATPAAAPALTPPEREEVVVLMPAAPPVEEEAPVPDTRTAADRLAPRLVDPRLWRPMVMMPRAPTLADVQARLDAAVELLSDSALAETQRAMAAVDWTVTDDDGGRWGVSPGKLHLGKLTLPLPIYFSAPGWDPEQAEWYDLEAQVDRTRFLESFEDRVRAIRERREREREEEREGGGTAG